MATGELKVSCAGKLAARSSRLMAAVYEEWCMTDLSSGLLSVGTKALRQGIARCSKADSWKKVIAQHPGLSREGSWINDGTVPRHVIAGRSSDLLAKDRGGPT